MRSPYRWVRELLALFFLYPSFTLAGPGGAELAGVVVNARDGSPIPGVQLKLTYNTEVVTSDTEGRFHFGNLQPHDYAIAAEKTGFAKVHNFVGTPLRLREGDTVSGFMIRMEPETVVSGRVVDQAGQPLESSVILIASDGQTHGQSTRKGEFRFGGLMQGTYRLTAEPRGERGAPYPAVYYPGTLLRREAGTITLRQGDEKTGLTIAVPPIHRVAVTGRWTGGGTGGPPVSLWIDRISGERSRVSGGPVGADGKFTLQLPPGDYRLLVHGSPSKRGQLPPVLGVAPLTVHQAALTNVVISPAPAATVLARFKGAVDSASAAKLALEFYPEFGIGQNRLADRLAGGLQLASGLAPDRYALKPVGLPPGAYVKRISAGGKDISETGLDLSNGGKADVEILVAAGAGSLSGFIVDAAGNPVPGARILIAKSPDRWQPRLLWASAPVGDAKGHFSQLGIAPGDYVATAYANGKSSPPQSIRVTMGAALQLRFVIP